MDIIKYFYEEPAALEGLTPALDPDARRRQAPAQPLEALQSAAQHAPRYHRGYLAGTDLDRLRIGVTALADPAAALAPLREALGPGVWTRRTDAGVVETAVEAAAVLREPAGTAVLVLSGAPFDPAWLADVVGTDRRYHVPALQRLLAAARAVLFPEPAHHGYDWSLFAAEPVRERLVAAFRRYPARHTHRFVLPYRQARSEEKFYFEQYDLAAYAAHEIR
ncbi:hypothetical protein AWN76_010160 [Rhodothermaceae bacterium RA]|nr:hypothetical protein AWN76_010160 [Rhodothermaceae bacterium RA]